MELQHIIRLIRELDAEIEEVETAIKDIVDSMPAPILTIPGISYRMGAMTLAEVGDFSRFDSPDKLLTYAGLSHPLISPDNLPAPMRTRRSAVPLPLPPYSMPPSTSAYGIRPLRRIWQRSGVKVSITKWRSPMLPKNSFA